MSFMEVDGNWPYSRDAWGCLNVVLLCPECLFVVTERSRLGFYHGLPAGPCFCPTCGTQITILGPVKPEDIGVANTSNTAVRGEETFRPYEAVASPVALSWWATLLHIVLGRYPKIRWRLRHSDYDRIMFIK